MPVLRHSSHHAQNPADAGLVSAVAAIWRRRPFGADAQPPDRLRHGRDVGPAKSRRHGNWKQRLPGAFGIQTVRTAAASSARGPQTREKRRRALPSANGAARAGRRPTAWNKQPVCCCASVASDCKGGRRGQQRDQARETGIPPPHQPMPAASCRDRSGSCQPLPRSGCGMPMTGKRFLSRARRCALTVRPEQSRRHIPEAPCPAMSKPSATGPGT